MIYGEEWVDETPSQAEERRNKEVSVYEVIVYKSTSNMQFVERSFFVGTYDESILYSGRLEGEIKNEFGEVFSCYVSLGKVTKVKAASLSGMRDVQLTIL